LPDAQSYLCGGFGVHLHQHLFILLLRRPRVLLLKQPGVALVGLIRLFLVLPARLNLVWPLLQVLQVRLLRLLRRPRARALSGDLGGPLAMRLRALPVRCVLHGSREVGLIQ